MEKNLNIFEIGYKNEDGYFSAYEKDHQSYTDEYGNIEARKSKNWYVKIEVPNYPCLTIDIPFEKAMYLLQRLPK